ncbi:hypothetical protein Acr_00g0048430 [Actinidia rufa]|uniref:Wall-associated receptor kinase C-terminal domain-containing protein n=1 Tax=Actinidia rufa TaxID=165716 RepID=A0A7J0DLY5_9ERIC|nr:hypothetical protein Acr_00g0048430 [Actinidia rufa]
MPYDSERTIRVAMKQSVKILVAIVGDNELFEREEERKKSERGLHGGCTGWCRGEAPQITIESRPYRVLSIDNATFNLNVQQEEFWNNNCPSELHNVALDANPHFEYAPNTDVLMLYYGCRIILNVNCSNNVEVRINKTAAEALAGPASGNVTQVLNSGFGLVWKANNTNCQSCVRSGGRCGTNSTNPGPFVCYCSDQSYTVSCRLTTSGSDHGTSWDRATNLSELGQAIQEGFKVRWKVGSEKSGNAGIIPSAGIILLPIRPLAIALIRLTWRRRAPWMPEH